jgi:1-acyl-sn-glycerol-3-phosphate acyltransferase
LAWLRVIWRTSRLLLHIILGVILVPLVSRRERSTGEKRTDPYVTSWWHGRVAAILKLEITTSGYPPQPPALIVANHVSWLDIIVLGHLVPTCFLSKDEVRQWPVIGWFASRAGTLFIRRGGGEASAISSAIGERLAQNGLLTLFPEGTTTDGREVRPFFSRLFAAAIDTGTPIAPVAIRYHVDGEFDPLAPYIDEQSLGQNLLGLLKRRRSQVHVHFAAPVHDRDANRKSLAEQTRKAIVASLRQSPPGRADKENPQQDIRQA